MKRRAGGGCSAELGGQGEFELWPRAARLHLYDARSFPAPAGPQRLGRLHPPAAARISTVLQRTLSLPPRRARSARPRVDVESTRSGAPRQQAHRPQAAPQPPRSGPLRRPCALPSWCSICTPAWCCCWPSTGTSTTPGRKEKGRARGVVAGPAWPRPQEWASHAGASCADSNSAPASRAPGPRSPRTSGRTTPTSSRAGMRSGRAPGWASAGGGASPCSPTTGRCGVLAAHPRLPAAGRAPARLPHLRLAASAHHAAA